MKKKAKRLFRQGDVLIESVRTIPEGAKAQEASSRIVLALGEATGHHHALEIEAEDDPADWWKRGEEQFVELKSAGTVTHQEHAPIALLPGRYRVTRQREYSPEEIRRVAD
jgi:hypothetical protein